MECVFDMVKQSALEKWHNFGMYLQYGYLLYLYLTFIDIAWPVTPIFICLYDLAPYEIEFGL